jgi:hypothetical protein
MITSKTASATPPTTPPTIAAMGTDEPLEGDGRPDCVEDPLEVTVSVTTCTSITGEGVEGVGVGCCGGMRCI